MTVRGVIFLDALVLMPLNNLFPALQGEEERNTLRLTVVRVMVRIAYADEVVVGNLNSSYA